MFSRRTLKLMAIGYAVKTVVFGIAWLAIPDLPQRAIATARQAWVWAAGTTPTPVVPASHVPAVTPR